MFNFLERKINKIIDDIYDKEELEKEKENAKKLEQVLDLAKKIMKEEGRNLVPIKVYVNSIGEIVRQRYIFKLYCGEKVTMAADLFDDLGFRLKKYFSEDMSKEDKEQEYEISLDKHLIIPAAWNRDRFVSNVTDIGRDCNNPFSYDIINHMSYIFLPVGITILYNGNHSVLTGVLKKEGKIKTNHSFDLRNKYNQIRFDGTYYREIETNEILHKVKNFELGVIFEIGRILAENNIKLF